MSNGQTASPLGVVDDHNPGTPATRWQDWRNRLPRVAATELAPPAGRVVALAPHPDDEILGMGGLLHQLAAAGRELTLLAVTDGTGSQRAAGMSVDELGEVRRLESARACAVLGLPTPESLGFTDGAVSEQLADLVAVLAARLRPGDLCLSTWRHDGHPDHEATARAARTACEQVGARLVEYPVWMWHWAEPGDERVPWDTMVAIALDEPQRRLKQQAVAEFVSQIQPVEPGGSAVLPPAVVARLVTDHEVVLR